MGWSSSWRSGGKGNVTERILRATAASYLISPAALASVAPDPHRFSDRFSAFWLLALAGRMVQEMGQLIAGAAAARQKLATFAIDGEITFRPAADRAAFAEELGVAVTRLVDKYHDGGPPSRRSGAGAPAAGASTGSSSRSTLRSRHRTNASPRTPQTTSAKEQDND